MRARCASTPDGGQQGISDHDRRSNSGRPVLSRFDGGPMASTGRRLRGHNAQLRRIRGRGHGNRRADANCGDRPSRRLAHCDRRSLDKYRRRRRRVGARENFRQLDGSVRLGRRRRKTFRRSQGCKRFMPDARHQRPGWQRFVVDENHLARRRNRQDSRRAGVVDRQRGSAGR